MDSPTPKTTRWRILIEGETSNAEQSQLDIRVHSLPVNPMPAGAFWRFLAKLKAIWSLVNQRD